MKKLTLLLVLAALLAGCAPATDAVENTTAVTDMVGRQVDIVPGGYENVVCIGAGALRMYCYVGDCAALCGVEDIDNTALEDRPKMFDAVARPYVLAYGQEFAALPSCGTGGPLAQTAEAEKILSCAPDLVISAYADAEKSDALQQQLGVPVITLDTGADGVFAPEFAEAMTLLGQVLGREDRAEALVSFVQEQTAQIQSRTADIPEADQPAVYIGGLGNWGTTDHLTTAQSYTPFRIAGIRNALTGTGVQGVQPIEEEKFLALGEEMDIMILDAAAVKNIAPLYREDPGLFDTCRAWQTGEVYLEMAYNAYYTNFEIALANTWFLAKTVYPDRFTDIDMTGKLNEITEAFLGEALAEEIFACPTSFGGYRRVDGTLFE